MAQCLFCSCKDESIVRKVPASMFGSVENGMVDLVELCVTCYLEVFLVGDEPDRVSKQAHDEFLRS